MYRLIAINMGSTNIILNGRPKIFSSLCDRLRSSFSKGANQRRSPVSFRNILAF